MKASWKDFVIEKRAQLFPGQQFDPRTGSITPPGGILTSKNVNPPAKADDSSVKDNTGNPEEFDFQSAAMKASDFEDFFRRSEKAIRAADNGSLDDAGVKNYLSPIYSYFRPSGRKFKDEKGMYDPVYDFYREIAPEIRKRDLGVDVLPWEDAEAYRSLEGIPVEYFDEHPINIDALEGYKAYYSKADPRYLGRVEDFRKRIRTDPEFRKGILSEPALQRDSMYDRSNNPLEGREYIRMRDPSRENALSMAQQTLAHELRHALQERLPRNKNNVDKLNSLYSISGGVFDPDGNYNEAETTNIEHQFSAYMKLRNKLGRKPTAQEYFKHLHDMSDDDIKRSAFEKVNGYQNNGNMINDKSYMDALRKNYLEALERISMNGRMKNPYSWYHFYNAPYRS